MLKRLLVILSLIVSISGFAKEVDFIVQKGETVLIEISGSMPQLQYAYVDQSLPLLTHTYNSKQKFFQTEFLPLIASKKNTTYTLSVANELNTRVVPSPSVEQFNKFRQYQSLLRTVNWEATSNLDALNPLYQNLIVTDGIKLPFFLEQNLALNLAYTFSEAKQFNSLAKILENRTINHDQKIILYCLTIQNSLNESSVAKMDSLSARAILLLANYAKTLLAKHAVDGEFIEDSNSDKLNQMKFKQLCGNVIARLESRGMASVGALDHKISLLHLAKTILEFALIESAKLDEKLTTARVLNRMWFYYNTIKGGNEKAGLLVSQALTIMKDYPDLHDEISELLVLQYSIQHRQGLYADIRKNLAYALSMLNDLSDYEKETVLFSAGHFYRKIGEFSLANRFFVRSIEKYKISKAQHNGLACTLPYFNNIDVGKTMAQLSFIEQKQNNYTLAMEYAKCAIEILESTQDPYVLVALLEKAKILKNKKNYDEAKSIARQVLSKSPFPAAAIDALLILFEIEILQENVIEAKKIGFELASHLRLSAFVDVVEPQQLDSDYPLRKIEAYALMIALCAFEKNKVCIEGYYKAAEKLIKKPQTKLLNPQAWNAARYKLVEQMVSGILVSSNNEFASTTRIFELLEQHYSLKVEQDQSLYNVFPEHEKLAQSKRFNRWIKAEHSVLTATSNLKTSLKREADVARAQYFKESDGHKSFVVHNNKNELQNKPISMQQIQDKIQEHQIFVRYFIADKQSFAIELSKSTLRIRSLPTKQQITSRLAKFMSKDGVFDWQKFKDAKVLQNLLPLDLLSNNQYTQLIITPDHILHRLPFAAINTEPIGQKYQPLASIIATYRTPNVSKYFSPKVTQKNEFERSIAIFSAQGSQQKDQFNSMATTRDLSNRFESLPALPGAQQEAKYITNLLSEYTLIDGMGSKATRQFLMSPKARISNILHIATHGVLDPNFPDIIALMTSEDVNQSAAPYVTLSELMSKPFDNDLVVISGCDTLVGTLYKGSGMRSLTRGFLAQGAGAVIGTLWSVPDRSTAKFMSLFYANLTSMQGAIPEALNATKQTFQKSGRYKHPKYWAGFVLTSSHNSLQKLDMGMSAANKML